MKLSFKALVATIAILPLQVFAVGELINPTAISVGGKNSKYFFKSIECEREKGVDVSKKRRAVVGTIILTTLGDMAGSESLVNIAVKGVASTKFCKQVRGLIKNANNRSIQLSVGTIEESGQLVLRGVSEKYTTLLNAVSVDHESIDVGGLHNKYAIQSIDCKAIKVRKKKVRSVSINGVVNLVKVPSHVSEATSTQETLSVAVTGTSTKKFCESLQELTKENETRSIELLVGSNAETGQKVLYGFAETKTSEIEPDLFAK